MALEGGGGQCQTTAAFPQVRRQVASRGAGHKYAGLEPGLQADSSAPKSLTWRGASARQDQGTFARGITKTLAGPARFTMPTHLVEAEPSAAPPRQGGLERLALADIEA